VREYRVDPLNDAWNRLISRCRVRMAERARCRGATAAPVGRTHRSACESEASRPGNRSTGGGPFQQDGRDGLTGGRFHKSKQMAIAPRGWRSRGRGPVAQRAGQRPPICPVRGSISLAKPNNARMPNGQAMKNAVSMIRVGENVTKCFVSLNRSCRLDTGENDNKLLRNSKLRARRGSPQSGQIPAPWALQRYLSIRFRCLLQTQSNMTSTVWVVTPRSPSLCTSTACISFLCLWQ
jgi:hypothetical protein